MEQPIEEEEKKMPTFLTSLLYKMDRTLAIAGIIGIAIVALVVLGTPDNIVSAAVGGLVGYVGGRTK